jgi:hypothetical protein
MLMLMACPPFPWIVEIGFLGAFLLWFGTEHRIARVSVHARWRTATAPILAGLRLVLSATELRYRYLRQLPGREAIIWWSSEIPFLPVSIRVSNRGRS